MCLLYERLFRLINKGIKMKHYYIVVYQSKINDRIFKRIVHVSRRTLMSWFDTKTYQLLSFVKISKREAKRLGYKFD